MKNFLILVLVILIAVAGVAYWRGWFEFGKGPEGKGPGVSVHKEKYQQDKVAFKKWFGDKTKSLKDRIAHMRDKSKDLKGDDKAKADKEIEDLQKKHDTLTGKAKTVEEAGEDDFESLKKDVTREVEEAEKAEKKSEDKPPK
jgi:hypothetical protein